MGMKRKFKSFLYKYFIYEFNIMISSIAAYIIELFEIQRCC